MGTLTLCWFGSPEVRIDRQPIEMETRKTTALLAYLSVTGKPHTRESLATLLWPEHDTQRALANLRRALWALNNSPIGPWLNAGRETVSLSGETDLWVDVSTFRQLVQPAHQHRDTTVAECPDCLDDLRRAVDLYRGDFLAGFTLADSPEFDDWQAFESDSLRQDLALTLQVLQESLRRTGALEEALAYARRWVALDRLNETAQAAVITLLAESGQRSAALRQYEDLAALLRDELDAEPQPQTKALVEQVRRGALAPPEPAQPLPSPTPDRTPIRVLPAALTPFIGRTQESREVGDLLNDPHTGLLTLIGPGGVGKTRLAIHVAEQNSERFADGVVFVPLAPRLTPEGILPTLATLLQFHPGQAGSQLDQLVRYLSGKEMLLVFDNFDHLTGGAGFLTTILQNAPGVKIMVTSRERLNLTGESIYVVPGMRFPRSPSEVSLENYSAYKLFLSNAQRVVPGYEPTEADRVHIARICQLLEGMPLAIELASGWMYLLSAEEIAAEIEKNIDFLTSRRRDIQPGHESLRAVFEHSWSLLPPEAQLLFARLSVFRGGFERAAAQEVAGAGLNDLIDLVDRSLLQMSPDHRFTIQEQTRQYAEEKLQAHPEEEALALRRHSDYFARFIYKQEQGIKSHRQKEALESIHKEIENVRLSWIRAVGSQNWDYIDRAMEGVYLFYNTYGWAIEGEVAFNVAVEAFQPLVEADPNLPAERKHTFARLLIRHNSFLINMYQQERPRRQIELARSLFENQASAGERARLLIQESLVAREGQKEAILDELEAVCEELRRIGDEWTLSHALNHLGIHRYTLSDHRFIEEAYEIARRIGNHRVVVEALDTIGSIAQMSGDFATAKAKYLEGLSVSRQINYRWGLAISLDYAGYACRLMGEYDEAERLHHESLQISQEIDDRLGVAGSLDNLGLVHLDRSQYDQAAEFFRLGLEIREQIKDTYSIQVSLENLAFAHLGLGELDAAAEGFQRSLALAEAIEYQWGWIRSMSGVISVSTRRGEIEAAVRLYWQLFDYVRTKAVPLQPTSIPLLLIVLGEIFIARRKPEPTIRLLQMAVAQRETWAGLRQKAEEFLSDAHHLAGTERPETAEPHAQLPVQTCLEAISAALEMLG